MTYEYVCKQCGAQCGTVVEEDAKSGICFLCRGANAHRAAGRPDCVNGDGNVVTASAKAFAAGERRCYSCWYNDYMDEQQAEYAPLFAPFVEAGYLCEVMQTGGMCMLPVVWFNHDGVDYALGLSDEVDNIWVAVLYENYGTDGERWADVDLGELETGPESMPDMAHRAFDYLTSQRWQEDLHRLIPA